MGFKRFLLAAAAVSGLAGPCLAQEEHGTGFIPLTPEEYAAQPHAVRARSAVLLSKVDLSPYMPGIGNQKKVGSCSAWAVAYAMRTYYLAAETGHKPLSDADIASPAFVFNATTTRPSSDATQCGGASITSAIDLLIDEGADSLSRFPYDGTSCVPAPTAEEREVATRWRLNGGYAAIQGSDLKNPDSYREHLEKGQPVIVGIGINTQEWFAWEHRSDVYTLTSQSLNKGGVHGGHAVVLVGYDDDKVAADGERGAFRLMNSWGTDWGDNGYMWISYHAMMALINEAYVFKDVTPPMVPRDDIDTPIPVSVVTPVPAPAPGAVTPTPAPPPPPIPTPIPAPPPPPPPPPVYVRPPDLTPDLTAMARAFKTGEVKVTQDGDDYRLTGYGCVDEVRYLRARVAPYGDRVAVTMDEIPWPACEIRGILRDAVNRGAVQASVVNLEPDAPPVARGVQITEDNAPVTTTAILRNGDHFEIDTEVQDEDPFVQIFYLQADQSAKEIWRGEIQPDGDGRRRLSIGGVGSKIHLTASRPYGTEAVLVLAGKGVVSPRTLAPNASEVDFMDRLRSDLGEAVKTNPDVRAAIVQVEVRDNPADAAGWLVTPDEVQSFGTDTDPGSNIPVNLASDSHAPKISVQSPASATVDGMFTLKATFSAKSGGTVRPDSLRILYRTPVGWFDVTDRVLAQSNVTASGITSQPLKLPAGQHKLRLSVQDSRGREAMVEMNLTSTGSAQ